MFFMIYELNATAQFMETPFVSCMSKNVITASI